MESRKYEVGIIGGGPGGYKTAELLGAQGVKTVLFERNHIGGVCLNRGCIPFKNYLSIAKKISESKESIDAGLAEGQYIQVNHKEVGNKRDGVVSQLQKGIEATLKSVGVDIVFAEVDLVEKKDEMFRLVTVNGDEVYCNKLVIATGSDECRPFEIPKNTNYIVTYGSELLYIKEIPNRTLVIGGGAVGLEVASLLSDTGHEVEVVEAMSQIGGDLDSEMSETLLRIMSKKGIKILTETRLDHFDEKAVFITDGNELVEKQVDCVIIATGRKPQIDFKIVDGLGVEFDERGIHIDDTCKTSVDGVYACGDVTGGIMLAHEAYRQAKLIVSDVLGFKDVCHCSIIPKIIYSDPEVVSVGISEQRCIDDNIEYKAHAIPMTYSGRYFAENGKDGAKAKMIINSKNEVIGLHIIGRGVSEISLAMELIVSKRMTIDELKGVVYAHPTYGEIIEELANGFSGEFR